MPLLQVSGVEETPETFVVTAVLSQRKDAVRTATVVWRKTSFSEWWAAERNALDDRVDEEHYDFILPSLASAPCTPGAWRRTNADAPPSARRFHKATWAGAEMFVWGGASPARGT